MKIKLNSPQPYTWHRSFAFLPHITEDGYFIWLSFGLRQLHQSFMDDWYTWRAYAD